jgi:hypothetical protein
MKTWWLLLISRSSSDSATTGWGTADTSPGARDLAVIAIERPSAMRWEISS